MANCLIVEGGSVTGLRTSNGTVYTFNVPISQLKNRDFIAAFEIDPIKALQRVNVKIEDLSQNNIGSSEFTNHSGGAIGSDTEWDNIGREFGMVNNKHYWTETKTPNGNTEITQEEFEEGRFESAKAAKRNFGYQYSTMKDSRLIRNWSQVKNSDAIFAIGKIVKTGEKIFPNQANDTRVAQVPSVTGGTGYAVGMGINKNKPVFVFNQTKGSYDIGWYKWDATVNDFVKTETPKLTKDFAGIGTREINDAGKKAIRDVYANTFSNTQETSATKPLNLNVTKVEESKRKEYADLVTNTFGRIKKITSVDEEIILGNNFDYQNRKEAVSTSYKISFENGKEMTISPKTGSIIGLSNEISDIKAFVGINYLIEKDIVSSQETNANYPIEYRYDIPFKEELKYKLLISDKVLGNLNRYRFGLLEANMLPTTINNAEGISSATKDLYNQYKNAYGDMSSGNWANDNFDKEGSSKLIMEMQESLLQDYYNYLKSIGYDKPFFSKYTGEIPDFVKKNFKSSQETIEDVQFSKFNTESNPAQDFKDLIQSLSDKLGIPVRYDNNLPYAGAFIDGNVVLNPSKMDETTVWHEFAHPFVQAVRRQNKPLYDNLVNEIYNTPHGKALLKEVQSLYGEKNQKIREEEVIVELIARYATGKIDGFTAKKYKSIWDKIKEFIRNIGKMIFRNNDVVDTSAVNVFTMNPTMSIKDISNMMKYSEIIWFSKGEENMNNYENKLKNLTIQLRQAEYSYNSKKEEIEAYKNVENYDVKKANDFLDILYKEKEIVKEHLSNLKGENKKGFKTNEKTVGELNGVHHNIGAFMSNAGLNTVESALEKIIDFLKNNKTMELAAWNGKGASLEEGAIRISFKKDAVVKDSFIQDAFTFLDDADSEGNRERLSPNTHFRDKEGSKINPFNVTESIISINKSNVESIKILSPNDWYPKEEIQKLVIELSDLTGAPVIVGPLMRLVYKPENKVEYQPEMYESRFDNKNLQTQSLKQVLSGYGISYDSFSPQLKSQIKTKLTNNPELLNDSNFIKSLTC